MGLEILGRWFEQEFVRLLWSLEGVSRTKGKEEEGLSVEQRLEKGREMQTQTRDERLMGKVCL